eukprot:gene997-9903_t
MKPMFLVLFVFIAIVEGQCNGRGEFLPNFGCSCYSGYYGSVCLNASSPITCTHNVPSKLKVDFFPSLFELKFQYNILTMSIRTPIVKGRKDSYISIQNSINDYCTFPGPAASQEYISTSPCFNVVSFQLPWETHGHNCSWEISTTPTEEYYSGVVYVQQIEAVDVSGSQVMRSIKTGFPIQITFITNIGISGNVYFTTNTIIDAVISKLEYKKGPPKTAIIEFDTFLEYPHVINSSIPITVNSTREGLFFVISELSNNNNCPPNSLCRQKFRIDVSITTACSLSGKYDVNVMIDCHSSSQNCPSSKTSKVSFEINSEDFCTTTNVNVGIGGSLTSFKDISHTIPSSNFFENSTAYFRSIVWADAVISSVSFKRVQWTVNTTMKVLMDNGTITADGALANFSFNNSQFDFSFKLLESHFSNIPSGSQVVVSANLLVAYRTSRNSDLKFGFMDVSLSDSILEVGDSGEQIKKLTGNIMFQASVSTGSSVKYSIILLIISWCTFFID